MHRPIYGASSLHPSTIFRITSTPAVFLVDPLNLSDFYNFEVQFGRYKAISLQPGKISDPISSLDYSKMKIIVLDLRNKIIEQKVVIARPGCGDGKYDSSLGTEECDDGNNVSGDGCDQNCLVEKDWVCTKVENAQSVCTYINCGNGVLDLDKGEECDDGNKIAGDGCNNCIEEKGWKCDPNTMACTQMCGDGEVYKQYKKNSQGISYLYFQEDCDLGTNTVQNGKTLGCTSLCKVATGWTCETSSTSPFMSTCSVQCGNQILEPTEKCDIGNAEFNQVSFNSVTKTVDLIANPLYDKDKVMEGCSSDCMSVTSGFVCPNTGVGICSKYCGNGLYEGVLTGIGRNNPLVQPEEFCDDGNNNDGDGCSRMCHLEDPTQTLDGTTWKCQQMFYDLLYELPRFQTKCTHTRRLESSDNQNNLLSEQEMLFPKRQSLNASHEVKQKTNQDLNLSLVDSLLHTNLLDPSEDEGLWFKQQTN